MQRTHILSTGSFLPEKIIANEDLSQFSPEARKLIAEKTGVKTRRHANESECTSDLAAAAARRCLQKIDFPPENLQGIVLSTSSPDRMQPATATRVQHVLGAGNAFAFDINSVCSGSSFGITVVDSLIQSGKFKTILLLASEMYSKILNIDQQSFYHYLQGIFNHPREKATLDLKISDTQNKLRFFHLESIANDDNNMCRMIISDISHRQETIENNRQLLSENRRLMKELFRLQEKERRTLASELHDEGYNGSNRVRLRGDHRHHTCLSY